MRTVVLLLGLTLAATHAVAGERGNLGIDPQSEEMFDDLITGSVGKPDPNAIAERYCRNIANAAADARYARQARALQDLKKKVDDRIVELKARKAELEDWLKRREALLKLAREGVVNIYAGMSPDAAAAQLALIDGSTAAALLMKLKTRSASAILNEMASDKAAELARIMVDIGRAATAREGKEGKS